MFTGDALCLDSITPICRLLRVRCWVREPFWGVNYWCYNSVLVTAALLTWREMSPSDEVQTEPLTAAPSEAPAAPAHAGMGRSAWWSGCYTHMQFFLPSLQLLMTNLLGTGPATEF